MERDGAKYVVFEGSFWGRFWRRYFIKIEHKEVEGKGMMYVSPFKTLEDPNADLYRKDFQDIKKAVRGAVRGTDYRSQKKELIKKGEIKTQILWDKVFAATGAVLILLIFLAGYWTFEKAKREHRTVIAEENIIKPETEKSLPPVLVELFEQVDSGRIQSKEGYGHGVIRQMMAFPERFGFKGNKEDFRALIEWAGKRSHQVLILAGYVDFKTGREIRVRYPNKVSIVINTDGQGNIISLTEHKWGSDSFKIQPEQINRLAATYSDAKFLGDSPDGVQGYEYVYQLHP